MCVPKSGFSRTQQLMAVFSGDYFATGMTGKPSRNGVLVGVLRATGGVVFYPRYKGGNSPTFLGQTEFS